MEILIALFVLGLVCALIKVIWEYFVKVVKFVGVLILVPFALVFEHWRAFAWITALGIVCSTIYYMFPMVRDSIRESRELKAREAEIAKEREQEKLKEEQAQRQRIRQEQEALRIAEQERQHNARRIRDKEDRIRGFAIKENPSLWSGYQSLGGSLEEQTRKVTSLRDELLEFGQNPTNHAGYLKACRALEAMRLAHDEIRRKLEEAYLESRAFEALPEHGKDRAVGCIKEAEAVFNRYKELSEGRSSEQPE